MTPLRERLDRAGLDWIVPDWEVASHVRAFVTTRNGAGAVGTRGPLASSPRSSAW